MKRRVVVTGLGAITPIGNDVESFSIKFVLKQNIKIPTRNNAAFLFLVGK